MRVIISAGGTGGHIYPALAIINKIKEKEPNSEFLYIGTHNRMEKDLIPTYGLPFESIEIYGFNRKNLFKNFKTLNAYFKAKNKCKDLIKKFNPDVVIGVGGYVTGPVISTAKKLGYKTFIHEQNSTPGKANTFLSKYADYIFVSFNSSIKYFPTYKTIFTGNPCSEDAVNKSAANKKEYGLSDNKKLVLFVMGSLGSEKVNNFLYKTVSKFKDKDYEILFVTGKDSYEEMKNKEFPSNVKVVPFVNELTRIMKKTDLMISRAGASTLSELISLEVPTILIPSPYVPDNHQYKNAMDLVNKDAAILIEEKDLKGDILVNKIDELINDNKKLDKIKNNLKQFKCDDSATKIYEIIKEKSSL